MVGLGRRPGGEGRRRSLESGYGHKVGSHSRYQMNGSLKPEEPRKKTDRPEWELPHHTTLPGSQPSDTNLYLPTVWESRFPAHCKLPLGLLASLSLWDSQRWFLRRVDWAPSDGAEFLGRLLPGPGFLRATGVGSWSGRFLTFLGWCLPAPLQGDSDVVAGPSDTGTGV